MYSVSSCIIRLVQKVSFHGIKKIRLSDANNTFKGNLNHDQIRHWLTIIVQCLRDNTAPPKHDHFAMLYFILRYTFNTVRKLFIYLGKKQNQNTTIKNFISLFNQIFNTWKQQLMFGVTILSYFSWFLSLSLIQPSNMSTGNGKIMVEFFSALIEFRVWRYLSCKIENMYC